MKVVFATDGSDYAARAAKILSKMTTQFPMELEVMMVTFDPDEPAPNVARPWYEEYREYIAKNVQGHFDSLRPILENDRQKVSLLHVHGDPKHQILERVRESKPDLVVLGARGHSTLQSFLLGSVSECIAFNAPCSVLVLRPSDDETDENDAIQRILVGVDGSQRAEAALTELAKQELSPQTALELVAVNKPPEIVFGEMAYYPTTIPDIEDGTTALLEETSKRWEKELPITKTNRVTAHHIGEAICQQARDSKAELIVLGDSGHSPLGKLLLGSTTKYVLRHADCSVWISRYVPNAESEQATAAKTSTKDESALT
jgi:nucleotide-binding universal stress UspA family protein